jgi:hypothetical protein
MDTARSKIDFMSRALIAIVMTASIYGCGGGGGGGGTPTAFTFNVVNSSGLTATEFYLAPSSGTGWGANQFSTPLASGSTRAIGGVSPCSANYNYYATNGTALWGPQTSLMPPCGGTFTLTLN